MDLQTIVTIVLVAGVMLAVAFVFLAEKGMDRVMEWIFRKGGLRSGKGPLSTTEALFHADDLHSLDLKSLAALDNNGQSWPIDLSSAS